MVALVSIRSINHTFIKLKEKKWFYYSYRKINAMTKEPAKKIIQMMKSFANASYPLKNVITKAMMQVGQLSFPPLSEIVYTISFFL